MSESKKTEETKELNQEHLKDANGGFDRDPFSQCPKCKAPRYDSWNKVCRKCGYRG